jgi:hypothetical protein
MGCLFELKLDIYHTDLTHPYPISRRKNREPIGERKSVTSAWEALHVAGAKPVTKM